MSDFGWQGLRRDLLAGLVGATISAAVLVPVGWVRISAEQRQSQRLRRELMDRDDARRERAETRPGR